MSLLALPPEILSMIVSYLAPSHKQSLKCLSLTCSAFPPLTTPLLCCSIRVKHEESFAERHGKAPIAPSCLESLLDNPSCGVFVRHLVFWHDGLRDARYGYTTFEFKPYEMAVPWHLLPNLRSLEMKSLLLCSMAELFAAVEFIPDLAELFLNETTIRNAPSFCGRSTRPLKVKRLQVVKGRVVPSVFIEHLRLRGDHMPLVSLELRHKMTGEIEDYLDWGSLLRMVRETLREVHMITWERRGGDESDSFHTRLLKEISTCRELRTLTLAYRLEHASSEEAMTGSFFECLCTHLEQISPPHPSLSTLHLRMLDRNHTPVSVTPALCDRLARTLLDKVRYPAFARLEIEIDPEVWEGEWKKQHLRSQRIAITQEWEALFGAFREAKSVGLQIEFNSAEY